MAGDETRRTTIAGTTIARAGQGVVIRGLSGSGKSDLALRALTTPLQLPGEAQAVTFDLVSDDQTVIERMGDAVIASAPASIRSLIEVRGLGIVAWPAAAPVPIRLVADLRDGPLERMPAEDTQTCRLLDVAVRRIDITATEPSSLVKLAVALAHWIKRGG